MKSQPLRVQDQQARATEKGVTPSSQSALRLEGLHHSYPALDGRPAVDTLKGVSLELRQGEVGCLLGPSGCGKTTLLRCIAGFEAPFKGRIQVGGESVFESSALSLAPEQRRVGMVFQDYALFPHLTVADNITFGLRSFTPKQRQEKLFELTEALQLGGLLQRYPHELSGGQQQRVALARALAPEPLLLLLDEPFSNLDPDLRLQMREELRALLKAWEVTALIVTHDQEEAFELSHRLGLLLEGQLAQWGGPQEVYERPSSLAVARFIGEGFEIKAEIKDSAQRWVESEFGLTQLSESLWSQLQAQGDLSNAKKLNLYVRPQNWRVSDQPSERSVEIEIVERRFRGPFERLHFLSPQSGRPMYLDRPLWCDSPTQMGQGPLNLRLGLNGQALSAFWPS